jgi:hypothetical protein
MDESHRIQPITISDISHLHSKIFETYNPNPSAIFNTCRHKLSSKLIINMQFLVIFARRSCHVYSVMIAKMGVKR